MDDNQIFSSTQEPQQQVPPENSAPRVTMQDLYGTTQNPPVGEPVSVEPVSQPVAQDQQVGAPQDTSFHQIPEESPVSATSTYKEPVVETSGGFGIPPFLKFLIGGLILIVIIFLVWTVGSFLFKGTSSTSGKVNLTYWGLWEDSNVYQAVINDFEKQHPDITVTYIKQDPKQYVDRLLTRLKEGSGPDIFRFHNSWTLPLQNILSPLSSNVIDPRTLSDLYPPVVKQDLVRNGAIYGLPLEMDTLALFVNKDIFTHAGASVPTNWDNFITVAKALTVKDPAGHIKTAGAALGTYDNIAHAPDILSVLFLQNNANLQKLNSSQNATDALTFYTSFANQTNQANVWDSTLDNSRLLFAKGNLAMYFGYSYDIFTLSALNPNLQYEIHPVPHLQGQNTTTASYYVEGIANTSKHQKEAALFLAFLAQKDTQQRLYTEEAKTRTFGELYARKDLASSLVGSPFLVPFISQYNDANSSLFVSETNFDAYNGTLNQYLANAINSSLSNTSVDSALNTLAQGVMQVTSRYAVPTK